MIKSWYEKGQGLTEYALILVLIAVVVIIILAILGPAVGNVFSNIVVAIDPDALKPKMHVSRIDGAMGNAVTVTVVDEDGAVISGSTTIRGDCSGTPAENTGVVPLTISCGGGSLPFCVTDVINDAYGYDSGANSQTCGP